MTGGKGGDTYVVNEAAIRSSRTSPDGRRHRHCQSSTDFTMGANVEKLT
jgi:hypothetical protein